MALPLLQTVTTDSNDNTEIAQTPARKGKTRRERRKKQRIVEVKPRRSLRRNTKQPNRLITVI